MLLLRQVLELAIVAWLPGAVVFRLPWLDRDRRAALDAEERLFWAVLLSIALSLSVVLALAVMHRYSFARLLVADAGVAALLAASARGALRLGPAARRVGLTAAVPAALILLGGWRFFPSSEYIIGGKDPGTYINEGIQIAQRGAIVVRRPGRRGGAGVRARPVLPVASAPRLLRRPVHGFLHHRIPERGLVVGQFPHLFPASIAIGYGVDGLTGARRTVGAWALLGLLAVYFAAARLVGRAPAAAAAALLALHVIEVWFARYPNAEVVMQALLFAALLANARAHVDGDRFFAPVAGLLLGAAALPALRRGARHRRRRRRRGAGLVQRTAPAAGRSSPCSPPSRRSPPPTCSGRCAPTPICRSSSSRNLPWWQYLALAVLAAAAAAALSSAPPPGPRLAAAVVSGTPPACHASSCRRWRCMRSYVRQPGGKLTDYDAYALRTFT